MEKLYKKLKEKLSDPIEILISLHNVISFAISLKNLIVGIILLALGALVWCLYWFWKRNRKKYYDTLAKKEFKEFTVAVMKRYYGEKYFTIVNKDTIPAYCMPVSETINYENSIRDFDKFCNVYKNSFSHFNIKDHKISFFNMVHQKYKYFRKYYFINWREIKRPNHPGFMLEKISTNNDGGIEKINNISVHLGSYAENVYTSDILEYELYEAYLHSKKLFKNEWETIIKNGISNDDDWGKIKTSLEIRNKITEANDGEYNSLINGNGRQSLISVQMVVVFKDKYSRKYKVHVIKRSEDVAQAPEEYQLVPCGGFDVLHELNSYEECVFQENLSPGACAFREYLEEVIVGKEFKKQYEGQGKGAVKDLVLSDPFVRDICKMLDCKKATLQFLGSSVSLVLLRHTLSFALIIHDIEPFHYIERLNEKISYSDYPFLGNHEVEGGEIHDMLVAYDPVVDPNGYLSVEKGACWEKMNAGSKASWYLFTQTEEYKKIAEDKK